jgi:hypothetical protein
MDVAATGSMRALRGFDAKRDAMDDVGRLLWIGLGGTASFTRRASAGTYSYLPHEVSGVSRATMVIQKRSPAAACIGAANITSTRSPHRDARGLGDALLAVTDPARRAAR